MIFWANTKTGHYLYRQITGLDDTPQTQIEFVFKGTFDPAVAYEAGDVVTRPSGISYFARADSTGIFPEAGIDPEGEPLIGPHYWEAAENVNLLAGGSGLKYTYSTDTSSSDPGAGNFKLDDVPLTAAAMYLSETDGDSNDFADWIATWDDSTSTALRGTLVIKGETDPTIFAIFFVTGANTDNGSWVTMTIEYVTGSGSLANGDAVLVDFQRTGEKGDTGNDGTDGVDGIAFIWKGMWSASSTYDPNDVVSYSGSTYISILTGSNHQPDSSPTYWEVMASEGADGSTGVTVDQTEIDFGATPVAEASFVIVDINVSPTSNLIGNVAYVAPSGKDLDELEMDGLDLKFAPGSGDFTIYARGLDGYVEGKFKINYLVG